VPDAAAASALSDARPIAFDIDVAVTVEEVLSGDALAAENRRLGIPESTPPTLKVWSANMRSRFGQRDVALASVEEAPTRRVFEPENGNEILLWDFSDRAAPGATFAMNRRYEATMHVCTPDLADAAATGGEYNTLDPVYLFYTKTEPFLEQTPEIRAAAREAIAGIEDDPPLDRARAIFAWVRGHMTYVYPPPTGRGCTKALELGKGDCGQYADLFVALCRANGIPARFVGGLVASQPDADGKSTVGSHAWAEMMLPSGAWLQMDATREPELGFGRLDSNRAMTMAVGRNIPLPDAPAWASYDFSEVDAGRTDFMQTYTMLATGMKVKTEGRREVRGR